MFRGTESSDLTLTAGALGFSRLSGSPRTCLAELRTTEQQLSRLLFGLSFCDHLNPGQKNPKHPGEATYQGHEPGKGSFLPGNTSRCPLDTAGDNRRRFQGYKGSRKSKIYRILQKYVGNGLAAFWLSKSEDRASRSCHIIQKEELSRQKQMRTN